MTFIAWVVKINYKIYSLYIQSFSVEVLVPSDESKLKKNVKEGVQPRFFKPSNVPYIFKTKDEKELDHLQQDGIIIHVQFSEWAAPIVSVVKKDGSIHICADFKLTVNQVSHVELYPLLCVDDIFSSYCQVARVFLS